MSEQQLITRAAERYLSRAPVYQRDSADRPLYSRDQVIRVFCAGHVAIVESDTPSPLPIIVVGEPAPSRPGASSTMTGALPLSYGAPRTSISENTPAPQLALPIRITESRS